MAHVSASSAIKEGKPLKVGRELAVTEKERERSLPVPLGKENLGLEEEESRVVFLHTERPTDFWGGRDVFFIRDAYICDASAIERIAAGLRKRDPVAKRLLAKGFLRYTQVAKIRIEGMLPWNPRWGFVSVKDDVKVEPFRDFFQDDFDAVVESLQCYLLACAEDGEGTPKERVVFVTANATFYKYISCEKSLRALGVLIEQNFRPLAPVDRVVRVWHLDRHPHRSTLNARHQVCVVSTFEDTWSAWNLTLDRAVDIDPYDPSQLEGRDLYNMTTSVLDSYVCDATAYARINAAAAAGGDRFLRRTVVRAGQFYRLSPTERLEDEVLGWKVWAVKDGDGVPSLGELEAAARAVFDRGDARLQRLLEPSMLESFRDFVRVCLDKREDDEYPVVAKQLVVFCTGNSEFFREFLVDTISWRRLVRVVKDVVRRRPSAQARMFVFRAWDVGSSLDSKDQAFLEDPTGPHVFQAAAVLVE